MINQRWRIGILGAFLTAMLAPGHALAQTSDGHFERTLTVGSPVNLRVETRSGDIFVHTGREGQVVIRGTVRIRRKWSRMAEIRSRVREVEDHPPIVQNGNRIRIERLPDEAPWRWITIDYDVAVPKATEVVAVTGSGEITIDGVGGPVSAQTGSGEVEVSRVDKQVHARSGSGDIRVTSIKGAAHVRTGSGDIEAKQMSGPLVAETGSGDIHVELAGAESVEVTSGSGDIRLTGVRGALRANTGSGSITAEGSPEDDWSLHSGSGDLTIRLPEDAAFDLYVKTGSGRIWTDHPMTVRGYVGPHGLEGSVGGGGPRVELRTGSGDIRIE